MKEPTQEYIESVEAAAKRGEAIEFYVYHNPDKWMHFPQAADCVGKFNWEDYYFRVANPKENPMRKIPKNILISADRTGALLEERQKTHGLFIDHARITKRFKTILADECEIMGKQLTPDQEEALHMIFHKIGRMIAGDISFVDHWDDVAGYARLEADILRSMQK